MKIIEFESFQDLYDSVDEVHFSILVNDDLVEGEEARQFYHLACDAMSQAKAFLKLTRLKNEEARP